MKKTEGGNYGLIGHTGFIGSTLKRQYQFNSLYRSTDIQKIQDKEFDLLVCAGAQAKKWMANKYPEEDQKSIQILINSLSKVSCKNFILISTVDVFNNPTGVNELSEININDLHPYGLNRRELEIFVKSKFANSLIVRLPGLVGAGLKKNIIYDIHNRNNLEIIDSRNMFQFYPVVNLWNDIQIAIGLGNDVIHLNAEPLSVREISKEAFGKDFNNTLEKKPISYNFESIFASQMGGKGSYTYSKRESLQSIRFYAQTEPLSNN